MNNAALDAGIPVLTEIIRAPGVDSAPPDSLDMADVVDVPAIGGWLNEEWNRLERKIGGRILHQVMARVESDIENRIRDALADALHTAVESLAADIKENLQHSLQEAIFQAVRDEISDMQAPDK